MTFHGSQLTLNVEMNFKVIIFSECYVTPCCRHGITSFIKLVSLERS